ncbi:MAG: radical SAM protein [Candidatus Omnitrophica bacterium]|nr:radical SAM protein [Candidatus Omnitrophota bacterium]
MREDKFRIESHKLIYHVGRVHDWLKGENIYPLYIEIAPFSGCNHRCIFCALDYLKYKPELLGTDCLKRFIAGVARKGVKSIHYAGEGEPLLHKDITDIVAFTKKAGVDAAITTNGVLLDKKKSGKLLSSLSWLRVSLNAGTQENYAVIHNTKKEDFGIVINNLKQAVKIRNKNKYGCTIGVQFLLIPQNYKEAIPLARMLQDTGVDYLAIKPYSWHPLSINRIGRNFKYAGQFYLDKELEAYVKDNFQIVFRRHAMEKLGQSRPYKHCLGLPFWAYIAASGDVYPCSRFLGDKNFIFGNICHDTFKDIWEGKRRKRIMDLLYNKWDINKCREACRLDEINRYLWELKNPAGHVNFI